MTDTTLVPRDRPLVTFALFAYNQEKYIREAVEGAFAQTYEPLEIILSDDCSSDRTFEIMQEMAAVYEGPHEVVLNQNCINLGLIGHVNLISDLAKGDYIAAAAGDDISLPHRIKVVSEEITKSHPLLIHSSVQRINEDGSLQHDIPNNPTLWNTNDLKLAATSGALYIGATGIWSKVLFEKYGKIKALKSYEDLVLGYRASLEGSIGFINMPLVIYRVGSGMSHIPKRAAGIALKKAFLARTYASLVDTLEQRLMDTKNSGHSESDELISLIRRQINIYRARYRFYTSPFEFIIKDVWRPSVLLNFFRAVINSVVVNKKR
jgi:glycosyltransferase involved in cell wall biosynthesis